MVQFVSLYCSMFTQPYGSSVISCMLDEGRWDTAMPQCFIRLMPAEKGFIVEMMRAKQSATSLFGAHANAGV